MKRNSWLDLKVSAPCGGPHTFGLGGGVVGGSASPLTPFGVRGQQQQSPSTLGQMSLSGLLGAFNPTPQFAPTASAMMPSISAVQSQPLVQHIPLR